MRTIWPKLLGTAISLALLPALSVAQDRPEEVTKEKLVGRLVSEFFARVSQGQLGEAAELFHYPPSYTGQERKDDVAAVALTLGLMTREFGTPGSPQPHTSYAMWYAVGGGGGDIPYWKDHPHLLDAVYRVSFSREGPGFVIFKFIEIGGAIEIASVQYGIPADRAGAMERIREIGEIILKEKGFPSPPRREPAKAT
jgi:hypothetical protein